MYFNEEGVGGGGEGGHSRMSVCVYLTFCPVAMLRFNIKWLSLEQKNRLPLSSRMPIIEHECECMCLCVCECACVCVRDRGEVTRTKIN